jgi:uncharacterized LabA/DUF88 family protein
MDDWDLADAKAQATLKDRFDRAKEYKAPFLADAGRKLPGEDQTKIHTEAWSMCFAAFQEWYTRKTEILDGMKRFYHGVRSSTDFIDIIECGHWKVDFFNQSVSEKGLDARLAVDMVALMASYDVAIVLSGDADSIPSIDHIKLHDKQVATVEFVGGHPPEKKGRGFSSRLKLSADLVLRVYETELVNSGAARKASGDPGPVGL